MACAATVELLCPPAIWTRRVATAVPPPVTREEVVMAPGERREAVLRVIRAARQRLVLSLFRCTDFHVLDELAGAVERGVRVEVLLTARARGWRGKLERLGGLLESMGVHVHRYPRPGVKYHAKYVVADDGPALVTSLNFTRKCFHRTCDFVLSTPDPEIAFGLTAMFYADCRGEEPPLPERLRERLIVGPEWARSTLTRLLCQARRSIRVLDHKLTDPRIHSLLESRRNAGVSVETLGRGRLGALLPHGKMVLIDGEAAVVGSVALSERGLDSRRELAMVTRVPRCLAALNALFDGFRS